jgi:Domain of unknown function (DUF397)
LTHRPSTSAQARWRKSSRSNNAGGCVELATLDQGMAIRDSKFPSNGALLFPAPSVHMFLKLAQALEPPDE